MKDILNIYCTQKWKYKENIRSAFRRTDITLYANFTSGHYARSVSCSCLDTHSVSTPDSNLYVYITNTPLEPLSKSNVGLKSLSESRSQLTVSA